MTSSILGDAFGHHVWATERLIDSCAALTPEQLTTSAPGTYGSIIKTLRHLVSSDGWYLSVLGGRPAPFDEEAETSLAQLREAMSSNAAAWTELLTRDIDPDAMIVRRRDDGSEFYAPLGIRFAQVIHHGTDHRSQVCTALTNLGLTPPDIDVWSFGEATGRVRDVPAPVS